MIGMKQPACVLSSKGFASVLGDYDSVGWESGRLRKRQCEWRMELDAAISISAGLLCCEHCCQNKAGNESSQVDFSCNIPVIDVTPPAIKLSGESDSGALGDFTTNNKNADPDWEHVT